MQNFKYTIDGKKYDVNIEEAHGDEVIVEVNGRKYNVKREGVVAAPKPAPKVAPKAAPAPKPAPAPQHAAPSAAAAPAGKAHAVQSPLPGVIIDITCNVGDAVKKGDKVVVLEAMKMENDIKADRDGTIAAINVTKGESVQEGTDLFTIA